MTKTGTWRKEKAYGLREHCNRLLVSSHFLLGIVGSLINAHSSFYFGRYVIKDNGLCDLC